MSEAQKYRHMRDLLEEVAGVAVGWELETDEDLIRSARIAHQQLVEDKARAENVAWAAGERIRELLKLDRSRTLDESLDSVAHALKGRQELAALREQLAKDLRACRDFLARLSGANYVDADFTTEQLLDAARKALDARREVPAVSAYEDWPEEMRSFCREVAGIGPRDEFDSDSELIQAARSAYQRLVQVREPCAGPWFSESGDPSSMDLDDWRCEVCGNACPAISTWDLGPFPPATPASEPASSDIRKSRSVRELLDAIRPDDEPEGSEEPVTPPEAPYGSPVERLLASYPEAPQETRDALRKAALAELLQIFDSKEPVYADPDYNRGVRIQAAAAILAHLGRAP